MVLLSQYSCHVNEALRGAHIFLLVGFLGWMVCGSILQSSWLHYEETLVTESKRSEERLAVCEENGKKGGRESF